MTTLPDLARRLYSQSEAGAYLGVGPKVFRSLVKKGLKYVLIGERKKFDIADLNRLIEEKKQWHSDAGKALHTGGTASASAVVDFAEARKKLPAKRPS